MLTVVNALYGVVPNQALVPDPVVGKVASHRGYDVDALLLIFTGHYSPRMSSVTNDVV